MRNIKLTFCSLLSVDHLWVYRFSLQNDRFNLRMILFLLCSFSFSLICSITSLCLSMSCTSLSCLSCLSLILFSLASLILSFCFLILLMNSVASFCFCSKTFLSSNFCSRICCIEASVLFSPVIASKNGRSFEGRFLIGVWLVCRLFCSYSLSWIGVIGSPYLLKQSNREAILFSDLHVWMQLISKHINMLILNKLTIFDWWQVFEFPFLLELLEQQKRFNIMSVSLD